MRRITRLMAALCLCAVCLCPVAQAAEAPYYTMTENHNGELVYSQAGYLPDKAFFEFDGKDLKRPSDLFVDESDRLYISDTGNKRVIMCTSDGELLRVFGAGVLKTPAGLFVRAGRLYVADTGLEKVLVYDTQSGETVFTLAHPGTPLYGLNNTFRPQSIAVDSAGGMYIISKGNNGGIAQFSADGTFLGYFGANETNTTLLEKLQRLIMSDVQIGQLTKKIPPSPTNLDMDAEGLVYTVTGGIKGARRLSMAGSNTMGAITLGFDLSKDVAVGLHGTVFVVDQNGYIMEYTRDGRVLFYFGGLDAARSRAGLFVATVAIDVDSSGRLYVLDSDKALVQRLDITEYAAYVHQALDLYQEGLYTQSRRPWERVLQSNSMFDYAYMGLGHSYFKLEQYQTALRYARMGGDRECYSDAFWEIRNLWLQDNLLYLAGALVLLVILRRLWMYAKRRWQPAQALAERISRVLSSRAARQLAYSRIFIRNPFDGCYGIRKEQKASMLSATALYALVFAFYMADKYTCGYLFKTVEDGRYDVLLDLLLVPGSITLFLVACNLICSIRSGEGTFKQMYMGLAYAFTPYLLLKPVAYGLSFILTNNEAFILTLVNVLAIAATAVLVIVMVRYMQDYSYRETFATLLLTVFTMLMMIIAVVIAASMLAQLYDFIASVWKEAMFYNAT